MAEAALKAMMDTFLSQKTAATTANAAECATIAAAIPTAAAANAAPDTTATSCLAYSCSSSSASQHLSRCSDFTGGARRPAGRRHSLCASFAARLPVSPGRR